MGHSYPGRAGAAGFQTMITPRPMPIHLARRCVTLTSEPGDVVLDPYAGSGTTLLAAAQAEAAVGRDRAQS